MPFFSSNRTARKRRKYHIDNTSGHDPVYQSTSLPATVIIPGAVYEHQQPHWHRPPVPSPAAYPHTYSVVSLPAHQAVTEPPCRPTQHQRTWSRPEAVVYSMASAADDLHRRIDDKLDDVISLIDADAFIGSTRELAISIPPSTSSGSSEPSTDRDLSGHARPRKHGQPKHVNVFSKLDLYLNSKLPTTLPPLRVYIPTYPLLCLAAQYSLNAYNQPQSASERKDYISADSKLGTKAIVVKSIPCDDKKTIVFAIRGTSRLSVRDWGVNLRVDPVSPVGFLDDEGNLCHSGFLKVAMAMVRPMASRLRQLLEENPNRSSCSLLITGHSAGGAVASLLYTHMLAATVDSELNALTNCFKRVHCVTFGAPPISLLPLQKPTTADGRLQKCLFHSFMNEGDPVVRAEKAYIKSLVDLLSRPVPEIQRNTNTSPLTKLGASMSMLDLSLGPKKKTKPQKRVDGQVADPSSKLWWDVPAGMFSNAGRLVVLRVPRGKTENDITASIVKDEQLRQVIFGDPLAHSMELYASRIETLAVRAVTGKAGIVN
ncbi:hypothetical protein PV08_05659 [Exophiala spinifera]|uniref:Fungal lipase-type domain-containing protein n=1 Tax=Exophiala spinifera TaxID=91928 RepID=A0A0D1YKS7_9EURO|nr:uncharacterized protein PV08_05659 [Exophiala spinifera]KIW15611.1 hypothetical protein PV08_05659 [Exophiala spinifera]